MKKGTAGFTLVELIVVIAILGVLAGIAIPVYSGYIAKAQEAADMQQLDSLKTAAVFAAVDSNPEATVTQITLTIDSSTKTVTKVDLTGTKLGASAGTTLDATAAVAKLMGTNLPAMKYITTATWYAVTDTTHAAGWVVQ